MSRGARLLRHGPEKGTLKLYGQDWPLAAGHRLGLLLSGANQDWWFHLPTFGNVTVKSARLGIPALATLRTTFLSGKKTSRMEEYLEDSVMTVTPVAVGGAAIKFTLPPPMATAAATPASAPKPAATQMLAVTGRSSWWATLVSAVALTVAIGLRRRVRAR